MLRKDANSTVVTGPFIIKNYGHMDVSLTQKKTRGCVEQDKVLSRV